MTHFEVNVYQTSINNPPVWLATLQVYLHEGGSADDAAKIAMQEAGGDMAVAKPQ